jgi:hypothetical protein
VVAMVISQSKNQTSLRCRIGKSRSQGNSQKKKNQVVQLGGKVFDTLSPSPLEQGKQLGLRMASGDESI